MAEDEKVTGVAEEEQDEENPRFLSEVETVGPCKVELRITIPVETIREEFDSRYREIIRTVAFPGFRVGHTPRRLVEKKLGDEVISDVKETLVTDSFKAAIEQHEIHPISEPDVNLEELELSEDEALSYATTLLVRPTVTLPDLEEITVQAVAPVVTDEKVQAAIDHQRRSRAVLEPVADGKVEEGDVVVVDFTARIEDEKFAEKENVECAQKFPYVSGIPAKNLPAELLGKGTGDTFTLEETFPDTWPVEEQAGKDYTIEVRVQEVKRHVLPEVDEEFVKALDYDSVEEFEEEIRELVEREAEREAKEATDRAIVDTLIEAAPFELPEDIIKEETSRRIDRIQAQLRMEGAHEEVVERRLAEARNSERADVERDFRSAFLMDEIARSEKIFVTEREVEERIGQMAAAYGRTEEEMEQYLEQRGLLGSVRSGMKEEKVMELLRKKIKIEE